MIPPRTKTVKLLFEQEALLYDIANCAYVEGDIVAGVEEHPRHQIIDITQDGNVDRVNRILDLAYAECVEMMYPYTKVSCEDSESVTNSPMDVYQYCITLQIPDDFSKTTIDYVSKCVHEYMTSRVLTDWLSITKPSAANYWAVKAAEAKDQIRTSLNARMKRVRRTLSPF